MIRDDVKIRSAVSELICNKLRYAKERLAQQEINTGSAGREGRKMDPP